MEATQTQSTGPAGNSSDFVSTHWLRVSLLPTEELCPADLDVVLSVGSKTVQVSVYMRSEFPSKRRGRENEISAIVSNGERIDRMLEDPSYSQIVRWGDENNSFVVLEVMRASPHRRREDVSGNRTTNLHVSSFESSARNLPSLSCRSISSTAILPVLYGNSTNMTSIKSDRIMRRTVNRHTAQMSVKDFSNPPVATLAVRRLTQYRRGNLNIPNSERIAKAH